jgi:hypothetical protein
VHVDQVADPLAQERTRVSRELLAPLEQHEVEAFFSTDILVDQLLDLADELAVFEYRQLHIENRSLFRPGVFFRADSDLTHPLSRLFERGVEALDFTWYCFVGDDAMPDVRDFPAEKVDWTVHDSR